VQLLPEVGQRPRARDVGLEQPDSLPDRRVRPALRGVTGRGDGRGGPAEFAEQEGEQAEESPR
jgi:hypothetical protein